MIDPFQIPCINRENMIRDREEEKKLQSLCAVKWILNESRYLVTRFLWRKKKRRRNTSRQEYKLMNTFKSHNLIAKIHIQVLIYFFFSRQQPENYFLPHSHPRYCKIWSWLIQILAKKKMRWISTWTLSAIKSMTHSKNSVIQCVWQ